MIDLAQALKIIEIAVICFAGLVIIGIVAYVIRSMKGK
jgi:preprotein translocase subunit Sss1